MVPNVARSPQIDTFYVTPATFEIANVIIIIGKISIAKHYRKNNISICLLTLKVLVVTIDAQWEGMGDVGLARYELALLPPCPTIRVLSYSNQ